MTKAYLYQAELFCLDCGGHLRDVLPLPAGADLDNESSFDSDAYPKGPYADGGGEADTPQHCGDCGEFLGNPLTPDGVAYVRRALTIYESTGEGRDIILRQWAEHYGLESFYADDEADAEPLTEREAAELAPQWGSYMTTGDPGAIMYSAVPPERPEHRDSMLRYVRGHCYPAAQHNGGEASADLAELRRFAAYLKGLDYA